MTLAEYNKLADENTALKVKLEQLEGKLVTQDGLRVIIGSVSVLAFTIALFCLVVLVILSWSVGDHGTAISGLLGIGGLAGLGAAFWRASVLERQLQESRKAALRDHESRRQDYQAMLDRADLEKRRFERETQERDDERRTAKLQKALQDIGHNSENVRVGAIYALSQFAESRESEHHAIAFETLMSFIYSHCSKKIPSANDSAPNDSRNAVSTVASREVRAAILSVSSRCKDVAAAGGGGMHFDQLGPLRLNLSGLALDGVDLSGADLSFANFSNSSLKQASLRGCKLQRAVFDGADLSDAVLDRAQLDSARFVATNLTGASLREARLDGAMLPNATIVNASFAGAQLNGTEMYGARANGANFASTVSSKLVLAYSQLHGSSFVSAKLEDSWFRNSEIHGARFERAHIVNSIFYEASIVKTDFIDARLDGSSFNRAHITDAHMFGASLRDLDLTDAKLDDVFLLKTDMTGAVLNRADLAGAYLMCPQMTDEVIRKLQEEDIAPMRQHYGPDVWIEVRSFPTEDPVGLTRAQLETARTVPPGALAHFEKMELGEADSAKED